MSESLPSPENRDAYALYGLAFLFLPVATVATLQVWILAVAATAAIIVLRALRGEFRPHFDGLLVGILVTFVAWSAISLVWTLVPERGTTTVLRLALVAVCILYLTDSARRLSHDEQRRFGKWLVTGSVIGFVLTVVAFANTEVPGRWIRGEALLGNELYGLNRNATVIAIMVWPVALVVAQLYGRYVAAGIIGFGALALFILAPATPLFAFIIGVLAFALTWLSQAWGRRMLTLGFVISVAVVPFLDVLVPIANELLLSVMTWPNSEVHRFAIWRFVSERIFETPIFGWGIEASRAIPGGDTQLFLFSDDTGQTLTGRAMPLHPHNAVIQVWLELGLVGVMLLGALFALIMRSIRHFAGSRAVTATIVATTSCAFAIAQLGFGIWQGWWMSTLGITAVILVALAPRARGGAA